MIEAIVEEIEIEAPPEAVYEAWTTPEQMMEWWGEEGFYRITSWTSDLRVGGKWLSQGVKGDGEKFSVGGEYIKVDPPKYLSFTWSKPTWQNEIADTTVELEFQKTPRGTLLKLKHFGFSDQTLRDDHNKGWKRVLAWCSAYVPKKHLARSR
jgi:uncharacterized protein YndB with AHSA1/START domain